MKLRKALKIVHAINAVEELKKSRRRKSKHVVIETTVFEKPAIENIESISSDNDGNEAGKLDEQIPNA